LLVGRGSFKEYSNPYWSWNLVTLQIEKQDIASYSNLGSEEAKTDASQLDKKQSRISKKSSVWLLEC
jgi:hypothetical protein